ncbi:hypothetical protein [Thermosynechococcus sp. HN-54]|nr:hypothetical protein [Thermosynechococcus sp. HN-54]
MVIGSGLQARQWHLSTLLVSNSFILPEVSGGSICRKRGFWCA